MKKTISILFLILPILLSAQDLSAYYSLLESGQRDSVLRALPAIKAQFPDSPEALYLSGLVETDGEKALLIYKDVLSKYPDSQRADDAFLKVIEFIYTKGLYNKTIKYSRDMIRVYPNSELIGSCVHFLLCSFNAMNRRDSVDFYVDYYAKNYPGIQTDFAGYSCAPRLTIAVPQKTPVSVSPPASKESVQESASSVPTAEIEKKSAGKYTLQFGAFSNESNASALKSRLKSAGLEPFIQPLNLNNKSLLSVRAGSFVTKDEARKVGEKLKLEKKIDYVIVEK
ncbi:MAG: SPOR domain-containing protein [Candidatus Neomarinimicrobiota bacterium]